MKVLAPVGMIVIALLVAMWIDDADPPADFTFVNRAEVFTLDPQRMSWMQDFRMCYALYEPLVRWNNVDFSIIPAAAEAVPEVSDDGLMYTFRIRPDAKWSNGAPVTAHDFIFSWMRAMLPDTAADYTMMFFCIGGAEDFFGWRRDQLALFSAAATKETIRAKTGVSSDNSAALGLWRETEAYFRSHVGLEALDDLTLRITLERPTPYFLDLVAFGVFHPVYRPAVEGWRVDDEARSILLDRGWHLIDPPPFDHRAFVSLDAGTGRLKQKHGWTKPGKLISNGPYGLTRWRYKRSMRLERNPYYHNPAAVKCDTIGIVSIEDPNTAVLAFERGAVDWLSNVSTDYQPDLVEERIRYESRYRAELDGLMSQGLSLDDALARLPKPRRGERRNIHVFPTFGTDFYSFNCRPALADGRDNPFHLAAVRRAFVAAVDRVAIVSKVTRLNEPVVTAFVPPGSIPGYNTPEGIGYDPDYARHQLNEAGWLDRDGDGLVEDASGAPFPPVDLLYSTNTPRYKNISLALRDMWQRELGVIVELRGKESKTFKEDLKSGNFMIGRGNWYGDYGDPTTFLNVFRTEDGNNDRGYSSAHVDDLLDRAANETDPEQRMRMLEEAERYLFQEEVPMLVLCNLVQLYMYEPGRVKGLSRHPRLSQYLWQIEVTE